MKNEKRAKKLSKILEYERVKRGMTHEEFAKFLNIPRSSLTAYIIGQRLPRAKRLMSIISIFNIDIAKFLEEQE